MNSEMLTKHCATLQGVYDIVVTHMIAQNRISIGDNSPKPICLYRSDNGCKCAAGILLADEIYNADPVEMVGISSELIQDKINQSLGRNLSRVEFFMIEKMQNIHDAASGYPDDRGLFSVAKWPEALRYFVSDITTHIRAYNTLEHDPNIDTSRTHWTKDQARNWMLENCGEVYSS